MVDMGAAQKLNRIILDTSKSPNDGPAGYELYLSTGEGDTWKLVASGKNAGSVQIISFPAEETSKFKIVQTGTKGNYWSIHELYAACVDDPSTGIFTGCFLVCGRNVLLQRPIVLEWLRE